jgi:hypothetical protein
LPWRQHSWGAQQREVFEEQKEEVEKEEEEEEEKGKRLWGKIVGRTCGRYLRGGGRR